MDPFNYIFFSIPFSNYFFALSTSSFFGTHHILSAPVIDDDGKLIDVVSIVDVVAWVLSLNRGESSQGLSRVEQENERSIAGLCLRQDGTVGDVLAYLDASAPTRAKAFICDASASAFQCWTLLSRDIPRLFTVDDQMRPRAVVTKHDMFVFLCALMRSEPALKGALEMTFEGLDVPAKEIRTLTLEASLQDALEIIATHGGAVPLVDSLGTIRANFSPLDVKGLLVERAPHFSQTCYRFLRTRSPKSIEPLCIDYTSTLGAAADKFERFGVHHLWLVSLRDQPLAPFSLTDFLAVTLAVAARPPPVESRAELEDKQKQTAAHAAVSPQSEAS